MLRNALKVMEAAVVKEYLLDTYKFCTEGRVLSMEKVDEQWRIKLDRTVFHPQGGGQPADSGQLSQGAARFLVQAVELDKTDDSPVHIGTFTSELTFNLELPVTAQIDESQRRLHARIHSAGHLLDLAVSQAGYCLVPSKGCHFPSGAYVEYSGNILAEERELALKSINENAANLIANTQEGTIVAVYEYEEATQHITLPEYLPVGRPVRVVKLTQLDPGCPCGGTHVQHVSEIRGVEATKLQKKGKNLRLSYRLV